jgi:hypothetical protein
MLLELVSRLMGRLIALIMNPDPVEYGTLTRTQAFLT